MRMTETTRNKHSTPTFDALVQLVQTIRPDWHTPGLRQAIRDALARDDQPTLAELTYAVVRCAENPSLTSPSVIGMDGPHWRLSDVRDGPRPPRHDEQCRMHPGHYADRCHACAADRLGGNDSPQPVREQPADSTARQRAVEQARAAVRQSHLDATEHNDVEADD